MQQAIAIIQPSLFEGWSTVVEDAKAIGQFIVLSSLPIHKEQISTNCLFFEPFDVEDLAEKMQALLKTRPNVNTRGLSPVNTRFCLCVFVSI